MCLLIGKGNIKQNWYVFQEPFSQQTMEIRKH